MSSWTEAKVDRLTSLWMKGSSAAEIAKQFGDVSRNAVIGKVHRLGLKRKTEPKPLRLKRRRPHTSTRANAGRKNTRTSFKLGSAKPRHFPKPISIASLPVRLEGNELVSIMNVTENMCHWPYGNPSSQEFHFCGNRTYDDKPYCYEHCAQVYRDFESPQLKRAKAQ